MDYYYVTGTSRGLGRALTERLLLEKDATVIGMARGSGPEHPRYRHVSLDLADVEAIGGFVFEPHPDAHRVVLVNNAGTLIVRRVGEADTDTVVSTLTVDLLAPAALMNAFVATYGASDVEMLICNISSPAARLPIEGAMLYCGAKAALEMMTRIIEQEAQTSGNGRLKAICIDPGAMDTDMQAYLRSLDVSDWSRADMVRKRYEDGQVNSPLQVAEAINRVLRKPSLAPGTAFAWNELPEA